MPKFDFFMFKVVYSILTILMLFAFISAFNLIFHKTMFIELILSIGFFAVIQAILLHMEYAKKS